MNERSEKALAEYWKDFQGQQSSSKLSELRLTKLALAVQADMPEFNKLTQKKAGYHLWRLSFCFLSWN